MYLENRFLPHYAYCVELQIEKQLFYISFLNHYNLIIPSKKLNQNIQKKIKVFMLEFDNFLSKAQFKNNTNKIAIYIYIFFFSFRVDSPK